jgi:hypothetical protein
MDSWLAIPRRGDYASCCRCVHKIGQAQALTPYRCLMQPNEDFLDPEGRLIDETDTVARKDEMLDKTIADTFPASDPPSSLPDPNEDSFAA